MGGQDGGELHTQVQEVYQFDTGFEGTRICRAILHDRSRFMGLDWQVSVPFLQVNRPVNQGEREVHEKSV